MRGPLLVTSAALLVAGCYLSYPLTDLEDAAVDPGHDPDAWTEPETPPITDSDGDCISDHDETHLFGTDPHDRDTDGDGLTDWQEVEAGTDPLDPTNGGGVNSNIVVLPFTASAEARTLTVRTNLEVADVYFLIDTTGSMDSAIENVATSLASVIVPALRSEIYDVQMGVGHFNDMPYGMYGESNDQPFWHLVDITDDDAQVQAALYTLYGETPWGFGGDGPESNAVALWCAASGNAFTDCEADVPARTCPRVEGETERRAGYPCFRPDSQPVIVHVSDASWHNDHRGENPYDCTAIGYHAAVLALQEIGAKHIGVFVSDWGWEGQEAMERMSVDTGAVDAEGEPLVDVARSGTVSGSIVDMIRTLAATGPMDVTAEPQDEPNDPPGADYDATLFVRSITPASADPASGISGMDETTFYHVLPGTRVTFDLSFRNDTIRHTSVAQFFKVWIRIEGDSVYLYTRKLFIIVVPPEACDG